MQAVERQRRIEAARRRREAAGLLRITAATAEYGSAQLLNGLSPQQARAAVMECAGELADVADRLRRLARLTLAERRAVARMLAAKGMSKREVARRVGVSERTVWRYLGHP